jgi:hypothetical protein
LNDSLARRRILREHQTLIKNENIKSITMKSTEPKRRIERLQNAYPFLSTGQIRALLVVCCARNKMLPRRMIERVMETFDKQLLEGGEHKIRNEMAKVEEMFDCQLSDFNE